MMILLNVSLIFDYVRTVCFYIIKEKRSSLAQSILLFFLDMQRNKNVKIANFSVDSILLHMCKKSKYFILR
jgi:hypothetical protein